MREIKLVGKVDFVDADCSESLLGGSRLSFRQGDLDGACGPYAVMTAMVSAGYLTRQKAKEIWNKSPDRRTKFGKSIDGIPALVSDGTDADQLIALIYGVGKHADKQLPALLEPHSSIYDDRARKGKSLIPIIRAALDDSDVPVILRLEWEGAGAHWVVVVGYKKDKDGKIAHFLVLDPGFEIYRTQLWNAILSANPVKPGPKPYIYWCGSTDKNDCCCQIAEAIFLSATELI